MASLAKAPRLFLVDAYEGRNPTTIRLFESAAQRLGIECRVLYADKCNLSKDFDISKNDLLYDVSVEVQPKALFGYLAATKGPVTVFKDLRSLVTAGENVMQATLLHHAAGLPVNKTIYSLTSDREILDDYVESLGGYPVIIKAVGGSHGVGVMRFDSAPSLYSAVDFLLKSGGQYVMRQFIKHDSHARLIVLDGEVIDSIEYMRRGADFRTNTSEVPTVRVREFSADIKRIAVQATQVLGVEFGGVDLLVSDKGVVYVAEVNVPCFFARAQAASGVDIAQKIITFMAESRLDYMAKTRLAVITSKPDAEVPLRLQEEASAVGTPLDILSIEHSDWVTRLNEVAYTGLIVRVGPASYYEYQHRFDEVNAAYTPTVRDVLRAFNKAESYQILRGAGLPHPKTQVIAPEAINRTAMPFVVKETVGHQGKGVYLVRNDSDRARVASMVADHPEILTQQFIEESNGAHKRLFVVGDAVVAAMSRQAPAGDFRSNVKGNIGQQYQPTAQECALAVRATEVHRLAYAGVDLIDSANGSLILEVNPSPGLKIESYSGRNIAADIIKVISKL